jgi:type II secretory pathway component PulF
MPNFTYTAIDPGGNRTTGSVAARDRAAALKQVAGRDLVPVAVDEKRPDRARRIGQRRFSRRVSGASAEAFSRELANLLTAGVPMNRALQIVSREASQPAAAQQWTTIHDDVVGGMSLADAMGKWPRTFPPVHVAMVRAAETGGFLDVVLRQIADLQARERDLKSKVRSALAYPVLLTVLATGVLIFLLAYFIPQFSGIFADLGGALPPLTRAIVAVSNAVSRYGLPAVVGLVLVVIVLRRAFASDAGRRVLERVLLRTPALGRVLARFALVRFCRMLGALLGAGVPLVTSLRVAREALGNQTLADAVGESIERVQQGDALARSLAACEKLFPASVVEMIAVAEESGRMDVELQRLAVVYEAELDRRLRTLVALAEPALLLLMAALVGTVVIGMLLPVFTLQEFVR